VFNVGKVRICVLHSHPDDWLLAIGGTMARYSDSGHDVFYITNWYADNRSDRRNIAPIVID